MVDPVLYFRYVRPLTRPPDVDVHGCHLCLSDPRHSEHSGPGTRRGGSPADAGPPCRRRPSAFNGSFRPAWDGERLVAMAAERRDRADEIVGASGPPWRTWVVVLAVVGLLVGYLVAHRRPAAERLAPAPEAAGATLAPGGGSVSGTRVSGTRIGPGPPGLRLLVGGSSPRLVDAATGVSTFLDVPGVGTGAPAW